MELNFTEAMDTGRAVLVDGSLEEMRQWYSLSHTRLATHLNTNSTTLKKWLGDPSFALRIHDTTAARIGQLVYTMGMKARDLLHSENINIRTLYPLALLSGELGRSVSSPHFRQMCQEGRITCYDMGVFGIYIPLTQVEELRGRK